MSGGFGIIVGYIFAFLALIGVFLGVLSTYNEQLEVQQKVFESNQKTMTNNLNYDYDFILPFYSSGRVTYILENGGKNMLYKKDNSDFCFSFFVNSNYVSSNDKLFVNFADKELTKNYRYVPANTDVIFSMRSSINISEQNTIKTLSCDGVEKIYYITSSTLDWFDTSFEKRKRITVNNLANEGINDYQIPVVLNSTNFDFAQGRENEIRFALPIDENYALDLPFDEDSQAQLEYSKYSNVAYLGAAVGSESSDPTYTDSGVVMGALNFDGVDDKVTITGSSSLQLNKSLTYSAWIKWNGFGNNFQSIITNGNSNNSIRIINDGGVSDNKVYFQLNVSGSAINLTSNKTIDSSWHHIVGTFDGYNMNLYIDASLVNSTTKLGDVMGVNGVNYIGTNGTTGSFFNGTIDEVKIFNFALNDSEVTKLYYNNLRFKSLDFYVSNWDPSRDKAKVFVKIPYVHSMSNVTFDMYYVNTENSTSLSASNIETTFSYTAPRTVGYVVSERADNVGIILTSLYDSNIIYVDTDVFNLDHSQSSTLNAGNTVRTDEIKMKYLAHIEGNGQGGDIIVPISWAGTNFSITNNLNANDYLCFFAPFATTPVSIYSNGVLQTTLTANYNALSVCDNRNYVTGNNVIANSTYPVLAYYSNNGLTLDGMALIPASSEDWYGVGSANMYVSALPSTSVTTWYNSNGASATFATLTSTVVGSQLAQGNQGSAPAFKLVNSGYISAFQSRDSDGSERSTFAPLTELGIRFGSPNPVDYVAIASPYSNANCSVYSSIDVLVQNIPTGTGQNGIYKYSFSTNDGNVQLAAANWYMKCDKPVWPYYDTIALSTQEKNLFGHLQMRQYIYPEPTVTIS